MNPVDRHTLARKLEYLRKQLERLEIYRAMKMEDLLANEEKCLAVERLLELSIQSVIDSSRLFVSLRDWRGVRDERDALLTLSDHEVLPSELADRLLKAKGFRNVLVHDYVALDRERLYAHLRDDIGDLWEFAEALAMQLQGKERPDSDA